MQQRARRAHGDVAGHPEQRGRGGQRRVQVGAPDVAPVHQPGHHRLVVQPPHPGQRVHSGSSGDEVDADRLDRGGRQDTERVAEVTEVARHQDVGPCVRVPQPPVRPPQRVEFDVGAVGHERGLVQLHPLGTGVVQFGQQLGVDVEEFVEFVQRGERVARVGVRFGQKQERHRPDQHRTGVHPQLGGLPVAGQRCPVGQREAGVRPDLRNEVVIVRVEPLGHLQRRRGLHAARHGEVGLQRAETEPGEPGRDRAHGHRGVQHVVVEGECVAGHRLQPGLVQAAPGVGAQPAGHLPQFGLVRAGLPVVLQCAFEFPVRPDAGPAEDGRSDAWVRAGQRSLLASSTAWPPGSTREGAQASGGAACGHPGHLVRRAFPRDLGQPRTPAVCAPVAGLRTRGRSRPEGPVFLRAVASQTHRPVRPGFTGHGVRSHSPLRGSPGLAPGSLSPRPPPRATSATPGGARTTSTSQASGVRGVGKAARTVDTRTGGTVGVLRHGADVRIRPAMGWDGDSGHIAGITTDRIQMCSRIRSRTMR